MNDVIQNTVTPSGGMNQDDSLITPSPDSEGSASLFQDGDYRYALNLRIGSSRGDSFGDAEIILDTLEVTNYKVRGVSGFVDGTPPVGQGKYVGRVEDKKKKRLWFCRYNENTYHTVGYYDLLTDSIYEVMRWGGLFFTPTSRVKMAINSNWMAMTDRVNAPRLFDMNTIDELFYSLGASSFREFHISYHKAAPVMPPVCKFYYDGSTNNYEKLKNKYIQFAYRYIYYGDLKSCFSPQSSVVNNFPNPITSINLYFPGILYDDPFSASAYNYFNHTDSKFRKAVKAIEFIYRESSIDTWRLLKRISVGASNDVVNLSFNGNADSSPISDEEVYHPFDTVPFKAGTVECIDNRFVFADILDERPTAPTPEITDVGIALFESPFTTITNWFTGDGTSFTALSPSDKTERSSLNKLSDHTFKSRGFYKVSIIFQDKNGWTSGGYTNESWSFIMPTASLVSEGRYALMWKFAPSFKPPDWAVAYQIIVTDCINIDYFMFGLANSFDYLIDNPSQIIDYSKASQSLQDSVNTFFNNNNLITATDVNEEFKATAAQKLALEGKLKPFEKVQIRKLRDIQSLSSTKSNSISALIASATRNTIQENSLSKASRLYININNWYNSSAANSNKTSNNPMNNLFYNYRKGDRVRFIGSTTAVTPNASQKRVFDLPIIEFTGTAIIVSKPEGLLWMPKDPDAPNTTDYNSDFIIEVYTPKVSTPIDYEYHECGEWYPVLYPFRPERDWSKSDWTYTNNTGVTCTTYGNVKVFNKFPFTFGDCFFTSKRNYFDYKSVGQNFVSVYSAYMTNNKDETYGVWDHGNGRPNFAYTDLPVSNFKETLARFGGRIIEQSFVNQINKFVDQDQYNYPSSYGRITDLINIANAQVESVGGILIALGENEAWSIYVNRTTLEDLSGNTQVSLSDKVLGSFNTLLGSVGCRNPESVSVKRGRAYWWSQNNGSWIRYGRDGATSISDYKMRNWFRELGDTLDKEYLTDELPVALSCFDGFNDELITVLNHSSLPGSFRGYEIYKGLLFSEKDTRWKSAIQYEPELMGSVSNLVLIMSGGSIYKHEKGTGYLTFLGDKVDAKYQPVFNQEQKRVKLWQTLAVMGTHKWSVESIESEFRGDKAIQQSSLELEDFTEYEDTFKAGIRNDENSTGGIIEGDKMRSKALKVMFKLDPDVVTRSLLHYAFAGYIDSPKNP